MMDTHLHARVAGVTFAPGYPRNLLDITARLEVEGVIDCDLIREHDNAHDLNAVAVTLEGRPLGHLPADIAAFVAPQLDAGVCWSAQITFVPVDLDHRDRPGLIVDLCKGN